MSVEHDTSLEEVKKAEEQERQERMKELNAKSQKAAEGETKGELKRSETAHKVADIVNEATSQGKIQEKPSTTAQGSTRMA